MSNTSFRRETRRTGPRQRRLELAFGNELPTLGKSVIEAHAGRYQGVLLIVPLPSERLERELDLDYICHSGVGAITRPVREGGQREKNAMVAPVPTSTSGPAKRRRRKTTRFEQNIFDRHRTMRQRDRSGQAFRAAVAHAVDLAVWSALPRWLRGRYLLDWRST